MSNSIFVNNGKKWTDEEDRMMLDLIWIGQRISNIALLLGRTYESVRNRNRLLLGKK